MAADARRAAVEALLKINHSGGYSNIVLDLSLIHIFPCSLVDRPGGKLVQYGEESLLGKRRNEVPHDQKHDRLRTRSGDGGWNGDVYKRQI